MHSNLSHRSHWVLLAVLLLAGCGDGRPELVPVAGGVTIDGKPLARGIIILEPTGARPARGTIVDGSITSVTTYQSNDGAVVGEHRVAIQPQLADLPADAASNPGQSRMSNMTDERTKSSIPARYADPASSGLRATIATQMSPLTFDLRSK